MTVAKPVLRLTLGVALAGAIASSLPAGAATLDGVALARRWCGACHMVTPDQKPVTDFAPSFAEIAGRHPAANTLRAFLSTSHTRMPDMALTRPEIDALVAAIRAQAR